MTTIISAGFASTVVAAGSIALGALMTIGAPHAHASEKSDCEGKGGTYTQTTIFDQTSGKTGTNHRCCVKDTATNTTSCTSTTVTNAILVPADIPPGVITAGEVVAPTQQAPLAQQPRPTRQPVGQTIKLEPADIPPNFGGE